MAFASYNNSAKLPAGIRKSPYEEGVYFVRDTTWLVGGRYELHKLLGSGSFSAVCLAVDKRTGEQDCKGEKVWRRLRKELCPVALKRIPNVLGELDMAKRVLREVCILRRLAHPNIITLKDAFATPSETGPCRLINGKLQQMSLDVYLALEYANSGDLFDLRGQLSADEVRWIMWQILQAVKYIHSCNVWHRDIKSANIMLEQREGVRIIKIGDFGSARSGYSQSIGRRSSRFMTHTDSFAADMDDELHIQTLPSRFKQAAGEAKATTRYCRPLTRVVATPCYRAPEVVMSRGGYTNMLDMWSVGCIFGELLQRVTRVGSATTPHLQVAPLFAIEGNPRTPEEGDCYTGPSCLQTRHELAALFNVVGTPAWACVEEVQHEAWRSYLRKLPGKAPSLHRRFGTAGEPAVDLLQRLLAFDPARRCGAEEALAHEYLSDMREALQAQEAKAQVAEDIQKQSSLAVNLGTPRGSHGGALSRGGSMSGHGDDDTDGDGMDVAMAEADVAPSFSLGQRQKSYTSMLSGRASMGSYSSTPTGSRAPTPRDPLGKPPLGPGTHPPSPLQPPAASAVVSAVGGASMQPQPAVTTNGAVEGAVGGAGFTMQQHYYEEKDPAIALVLLEEELGRISMVHANDGDAARGALRALLEREVAQVQEAHSRQHAGADKPERMPSPLPPPSGGLGLVGMLGQQAAKLQLDGVAQGQTAEELAQQRLAFVADAQKGALDPAKHLGPARHGEWTSSSGLGTRPGPQWGVSVMPPGSDPNDPKVLEAIRRQQAR